MSNAFRSGLLVCITTAIIAAPVVPAAAGTIPLLINYQGSLSNKAGQPVRDGNYPFVFSAYAVPAGGTPLWWESWTGEGAVAVVEGEYGVLLGSHAAIPASLFRDNPDVYLGVRVGADGEMMPRQRIASVPYAFTSYDGVPKNGIIMWSGTVANIPAGWALCDGQPKMAPDGTTVTPPDLRDKFVLGAGGSLPAAGGEAAHTLTLAELPSHTHVQIAHTHVQNEHTHTATAENKDGKNRLRAGTGGGGTYPAVQGVDAVMAINQDSTAVNREAGGGQAHNNLPPYYALAFIMKL